VEEPYAFYFRITEKCNFQCRHCCYECGPKGSTMSNEDIAKVIENMPDNTKGISISGGEPFVTKDSLMFTLDNLRKKFGNIGISVQTNGHWLNDVDSSYEVLEELIEKGVSTLEWTGHDDFHKEQGLDIIKTIITIRDVEEKLKEKYGDLPIEIKGRGCKAEPYKMGRAEKMPETEVSDLSYCNVVLDIDPFTLEKRAENRKGLVIDSDGSAYLCCWRGPILLGSAVEEPVEEIYNRAIKNPVIKALMEDGPRGAAKELGIYKKKDHESYTSKACKMCREIFKDFKL